MGPSRRSASKLQQMTRIDGLLVRRPEMSITVFFNPAAYEPLKALYQLDRRVRARARDGAGSRDGVRERGRPGRLCRGRGRVWAFARRLGPARAARRGGR